LIVMASAGAGDEGSGRGGPSPNVEDLLRKLNLTEEEEAVMDFSDEEDLEIAPAVEFALLGKVLSPSVVHINTVRAVMKAAWGSPIGLKIRQIGEKEANMFAAEFESGRDLDRIQSGTPWLIDKYAVLLKEYDERLHVSEIVFDEMEIWVRILDLPLGWMNRSRGSQVMAMIGRVIEMDVDADGKACGAFMRARVSMEIDKPVRRGVLLHLSRNDEPRWYKAQYEKLPFICFSCGKLDHSVIHCPTPAERDEEGKLPYDT
jgi:hypothetical protein